MRFGIVRAALVLPLALGSLRAAAGTLSLAPGPDGALELRDGARAVASLSLKTASLRRGAPQVRQLDVDGHRVVDVRVPVRGTAGQEVWVAELGAGPPRVIWSGVTGPSDADEEAATWVDVTADQILEYQTAALVTRCDGVAPRLFPRGYDFDAGRFRPVMAPPPPPGGQKLVARRGDPAMPAGRPIGDFHWTAASTTASAGADARALGAPAALNDGDPATAWTEGLGGDGRGEFLTARSAGAGYAVRGLRIFPGDGSSLALFKGRNRVRRFQLALGPAPEQRFDVELPEDPAADAARWAQPYWVALPRPAPSACITVVLTEVVRGSQAAPPRDFGTTAIGDLAIFTEVDGPDGAERLVADLARAPDCAARVQTVVALGAAAVLPTSQAVMSAHGVGRECLVEALVTLEPRPRSAIVTAALVSAVNGATVKEERLITAALRQASPAPPLSPLQALLGEAQAPLPDRERAARMLGALGDEPAAVALLAAVGHGPEPLRAGIVQALAGASALRAETLLAAVAHADGEGEARQADLLRVLPAVVERAPAQRAEALASLRAALAPTRPFAVRGRAVMALGALGGAEATTQLAALRGGSDDPVLRYLAARELAAGGGAAAPALRAALDDHDPRVRETAALGLGQLGDGAASGALIEGAKQEPWPFVRRAELEALGHLCGPGTGDLMVRASERDVDEVRRAALVSLVRCHDPRGKTILIHALGRRNEAATLRELAAALLGELGDRATAPQVAAALDRLVNESEADLALEGVAASALRALARLGGPQAVAATVTLAKDVRHPFRANAIEALGTLCDPGPGAAMLRTLEAGSDPSLAAAAQSAAKRCATK